MFLVSEVLVQFGIEGGFNSQFDQLLSKSSEIFFRLNVFGQLGGHGFEFFLVQLHTHDGILLKWLLSRGQLHNLVYRLFCTTSWRATRYQRCPPCFNVAGKSADNPRTPAYRCLPDSVVPVTIALPVAATVAVRRGPVVWSGFYGVVPPAAASAGQIPDLFPAAPAVPVLRASGGCRPVSGVADSGRRGERWCRWRCPSAQPVPPSHPAPAGPIAAG